MKLQLNEQVATGEGFDEVADFKIDMNPKAFQVLSDTIYTDKIGSIVRELSCNAFDAHVDSGQRDVPFEIHLPDSFEPHFSIRDFGKGISPEDIKQIYTSYFSSTKDNDNDAIGAFGLGSKTPFSYTDAFTVISIHKGVKCMYNVHKSAGMPRCVAYGKPEPTDEPDGLEVNVAVESQDCSSFADAVKRQLKFFPVKPTITNGNIDWPTYTPILEVKGFTLYEIDDVSGRPRYYGLGRREKSVLAGLFLKQGPVAYPVNFDTLGQVMKAMDLKQSSFYQYLSEAMNHTFNKGIIIDMPIGTVEVTASREGISYKDITVKNIVTRFEQIAKVIAKEVEQRLDQAYDEGVLNFTNVMGGLDSYFTSSLKASDLKDRYKRFMFKSVYSSSRVLPRLKVDAKKFDGVTYRKYDLVSYTRPRATSHHVLEAAYIDIRDKDKGKENTLPLDLKDIDGCTDNDGNRNVVFVKDITNNFVNRFSEGCDSRVAILFELVDGTTKDDLQKLLGDEFVVRNISELPLPAKASVSRAGHSITGGRQRLWFDLDEKNIRTDVLIGVNTFYAVGCRQEFGESFDDVDRKKAYFITHNNKLDPDKVKLFSDDEGVVKLFCRWLKERDYDIVAMSAPMAKKASDTGYFENINDLWKQYEKDFIDSIWSMFSDGVKYSYYTYAKNAMMRQYRHNASFSDRFKILEAAGIDVTTVREKLDTINEQLNKGNQLDRTSLDAIEELVNSHMTKKYQTAYNWLRINAIYNDHEQGTTMAEVEKKIEAAGIDLEVKVTDFFKDVRKLTVDNIDRILLQAVLDGDNSTVNIETMRIPDPYGAEDFFPHEEVIDALEKKMEKGA